MSLDRLWISDSSPLFVYSTGDQFGNTNAPWTAQPGASPNETAHQTSGSAGVGLSSLYTSSFAPVWQKTAEYTVLVSVNDTPGTDLPLGSTVSVDYGLNNFSMTVQCASGSCSSPFTFQGGWIGMQPGSNGAFGQGAQIDDTDPSISYTGFQPVPLEAGILQVTEVDYGQSLISTGTEGAQASVAFKGSTIALYGLTGPSLGAFSVNIDGADQGTWSAANSIEAHGVVLFFVANLDPAAEHTLSITAVAGGNSVGLVLDSFLAYSSQGNVGFGGSSGTGGTGSGANPTSSPAPSGNSTSFGGASAGAGTPNGGVIAGAILGSMLGLLLLIWAFRRGIFVMKMKEKKMNPWDEANMLQKQKNEAVHVTTVANQRYVYPGLVAHSKLK